MGGARLARARMPPRPGPWCSPSWPGGGEYRHRPRQQAVRRTACFAQILSAICPWSVDRSNSDRILWWSAPSARTCIRCWSGGMFSQVSTA